jgi:hypothetical protein
MRLLAVLLILAGRPAVAADPADYLKTVRAFVDTMMEKGTDRYGTVHSPLFAAMLDLDRLALPVTSFPPHFYKGDGMHQAFGFGLPDPPVGIRPTDRSPSGNNLDHDIMLLRTMFELSAITGDKRYAAHADAYLTFWLRNCQSPETGLMATGEHSSWDFLRERTYGGHHEVFRRFPFWPKLYTIDAWRASRLADALWLSQIGNRRVGDFSRHAAIDSYGPMTDAAYPRHAGFYIQSYANAYAETRDPKFIERIEVLIESRTGIRPQPASLLLDPGAFKPEESTDPALRLLLWEATDLVPARRESWRAIVRQLDEKAFAKPDTESLASASTPLQKPADQARRQETFGRLAVSGRALLTSGGVRTRSTTLSPLWKMDYGSAGASGRALLDYTRWRQTRDRRFLNAAASVADRLLAEGLPTETGDLWPRACGQVISLLVTLADETALDAPRRQGYLPFARQVAGMALAVFPRNGLFRADGTAQHYEAVTGADDLLWGLLQLHAALSTPQRKLSHNDVNW